MTLYEVKMINWSNYCNFCLPVFSHPFPSGNQQRSNAPLLLIFSWWEGLAVHRLNLCIPDSFIVYVIIINKRNIFRNKMKLFNEHLCRVNLFTNLTADLQFERLCMTWLQQVLNFFKILLNYIYLYTYTKTIKLCSVSSVNACHIALYSVIIN